MFNDKLLCKQQFTIWGKLSKINILLTPEICIMNNDSVYYATEGIH